MDYIISFTIDMNLFQAISKGGRYLLQINDPWLPENKTASFQSTKNANNKNIEWPMANFHLLRYCKEIAS